MHQLRAAATVWIALVTLASAAVEPGAAAPKKAGDAPKIVLIAGHTDHPPGTHEHRRGMDLFAYALKRFKREATVEVYDNGWPDKPDTLDDADTIVFFTDGSNEKNPLGHPLLKGDRLDVLEKQMKRGCGLVLLHYANIMPTDPMGKKMLDWVGGYFDFESGPEQNGKKWWSAISTCESDVTPASPQHPILSGVKPFKIKDEWYYNLRFTGTESRNDPTQDPRVTPIFNVAIPGAGNPQTVAWAVQRTAEQGGGRGFAFTGGHFHANWRDPELFRTMLNAVVWTAGMKVPAEGVKPQYSQWENPPRWAQMDVGPFLTHTLDPRTDQNSVGLKTIAIRIGDKGEAAMAYDTDMMRLISGWRGEFIEYNNGRGALLGFHRAGATSAFSTPVTPGWSSPDGGMDNPAGHRWGPLPTDWLRYDGLYTHGDRITLSYTVGAARVLEAPWYESSSGTGAFVRNLDLSGVTKPMTTLITFPAGGQGDTKTINGVEMQMIVDGANVTAVAIKRGGASTQAVDGWLRRDDRRVTLNIPADQRDVQVKVFIWNGPVQQLGKFTSLVKASPFAEPLEPLTKPGPTRWGEPLVTKGVVGKGEGAYLIDTITPPFDNPWHALLHFGGFDFFDNGDAAICTMEGDVWIVSGIDGDLDKLTWKRYATGMFYPLGLKIVDGKVYVLGRDQITRLHDRDGDGEADWYENFCNLFQNANYTHGYATCLETDPQGNFYFVSCASQTPHGGTLLKVTPDGRSIEVLATGFRNPNGMSVSPTGVITEADQQGTWVPASRIDVLERGGFYGYVPSSKRKEDPTTYDGPLCWIPHGVDNSCGGQTWVTGGKWGAFDGHMIHLSYGKCTAFVVLDETVDGARQGGVVQLPGTYASGVMRARFNPRDGQLYVCGLQGWQTSGPMDGCFQRLRYTGEKVYMPNALHVHANGVSISFTQPLDKEVALDPESWAIEQWQYRWTKNYGSPEFSVAEPDKQAHDPVAIKSVKLSADGRTVFLEAPDIKPVMQMKISYDVDAADGELINGAIYNTIHKLGPAK
ncbi:MAG: hypothetical protein GC159_23335 [Phycisphaera sp.]|nr:hypothetical protein [Phycisphaera sp.]